MRIGIVISTNEAEVVWNALRFGLTALKESHEVRVFLMNRGVEIEEIRDERYNLREQADSFLKSGGEILACGTCLRSRDKDGLDICVVSTMKDLLKLVEESDRVMTFG